jgi:hypothetical protein
VNTRPSSDAYQVLSLNLPEDHDHPIEINPAIRYGGQVRTRVIVSLNPRVWTAVGKKFLNPFAPRWQCCMNANSQTLRSFAASTRPFQVVVCPEFPTVSREIRSLARVLSSGVSHRVVRGSSARMKNAISAITSVKAPCIMKSHRQPAMPA